MGSVWRRQARCGKCYRDRDSSVDSWCPVSYLKAFLTVAGQTGPSLTTFGTRAAESEWQLGNVRIISTFAHIHFKCDYVVGGTEPTVIPNAVLLAAVA